MRSSCSPASALKGRRTPVKVEASRRVPSSSAETTESAMRSIQVSPPLVEKFTMLVDTKVSSGSARALPNPSPPVRSTLTRYDVTDSIADRA